MSNNVSNVQQLIGFVSMTVFNVSRKCQFDFPFLKDYSFVSYSVGIHVALQVINILFSHIANFYHFKPRSLPSVGINPPFPTTRNQGVKNICVRKVTREYLGPDSLRRRSVAVGKTATFLL